MRLGTYTTTDDSAPWTGVRTDDTIVRLPEAGQAAGLNLPDSTSDLLEAYAWREKANLAVAYAEETGVGLYDTGEVSRHAPVTDPQKVVCVGLNYRDHAEEGDHEIPDTPVLFSKFPTTVAGPDGTISWDPDLTEKVDYEAELVAVVGTKARRWPVGSRQEPRRVRAHWARAGHDRRGHHRRRGAGRDYERPRLRLRHGPAAVPRSPTSRSRRPSSGSPRRPGESRRGRSRTGRVRRWLA